jgi:hypothetical protein
MSFGRKIDKMGIKIPTSSVARPSKGCPNWDFWFENIPSGGTAFRPGDNPTIVSYNASAAKINNANSSHCMYVV